MHQTLTNHQAASILADDSHSTFSYEGGLALVEFLEEMEADSGSMELDPIAIRCDFAEYPSAIEAAEQLYPRQYFDELMDSPDCGEDTDEQESFWRDHFREDGSLVAEFFDGIILHNC